MAFFDIESPVIQPNLRRGTSHIHVIEPEEFPFPKNATGPREVTMLQALSNAGSLGMANNDVGPSRGRSIVCFDPEEIDFPTLQSWHDLGVRGVRVNLRSTKSILSPTEIRVILRKYAQKLRPMKTWSIGLYANMSLLDHIEPLVSKLDVNIALEHFASPAFLPLDPVKMPGWQALNRMMENPRVFVKISAPYLFSKDSEFDDLRLLTKSLYAMRNGEGVVFASDWPHTQSRGFDAKPFIDRCIEWCDGDEELQKKLFRDNAKNLWDAY